MSGRFLVLAFCVFFDFCGCWAFVVGKFWAFFVNGGAEV